MVPPRVLAPAWTRRVQGWSFLLFFVSLIILTFVAVLFYNQNDYAMSALFGGLASVVPVVLVGLVYYALPVWGMSVPLTPDGVAGALAAATGNQAVEPVAERDGLFARCVAVVHFEAPRCTLGWSPGPSVPAAGGSRAGSIVVLRPESRDRKALAAFRESLATTLLDATRRAA